MAILSSLAFFKFWVFFHLWNFSNCGYSFILCTLNCWHYSIFGIFQIMGILSSLAFFKLRVFFHLWNFKLRAFFHLWQFSNYGYSFSSEETSLKLSSSKLLQRFEFERSFRILNSALFEVCSLFSYFSFFHMFMQKFYLYIEDGANCSESKLRYRSISNSQ